MTQPWSPCVVLDSPCLNYRILKEFGKWDSKIIAPWTDADIHLNDKLLRNWNDSVFVVAICPWKWGHFEPLCILWVILIHIYNQHAEPWQKETIAVETPSQPHEGQQWACSGRASGDQERITHLKLSSSDTFIQERQRENVAWITIEKLQAPKASAL